MWKRVEVHKIGTWGSVSVGLDDRCRYVKTVDKTGNYHQHSETMDGRQFGIPWDTTVQAMGYKDTKEFLVEMRRRKQPFTLTEHKGASQ